jgi:decaprenyl-phosphate phosphoribosyltransferase
MIQLIDKTTGSGYWQVMRIDHWIKNIFVLPGVFIALTVVPEKISISLIPVLLLGLFSIGLIASSNYVLNEILDAPRDSYHPSKRTRPVPAGTVRIRYAIVQWILLMVLGVGLGFCISKSFAITMIALWVQGILYNVPPTRTKDLPYIDVLSEAVNNPLRLIAGWFIVGLPFTRISVSLVLSCWMIGCYFMGIKRYAEVRALRTVPDMGRYRPVLVFYSEATLISSIMFYASASMLFLGAFMMRYRMELILSFPLIAIVMAVYLRLAFEEDSAVQAPEKLYRQPVLMISVTLCAIVIIILLFVDIPMLYKIFRPTLPLPKEF